MLYQTEAAECGVACLAMVASYHGHAVDVGTLRRRLVVSLRGTTLATLMVFAERLGLASRAVRVELAGLGNVRTPCILHWNFNHFVVLAGIGRRSATIHDPSRGARAVPLSEVATAFTGVALELWPNPRFERRRADPAVRVRDLVGRVTGLKRALATVLALAAALELFALANPLLIQLVVDQALVAANRDLLTLLAWGFGLLVLCEQSTAALRALVILRFGAMLNVQWHGGVFARLLALPLAYFEKRHLGDIASRFRSIDAIQRGLTTASVEAVVDGAMGVALVSVMAWYSVPLALLCAAATLVYGATRWLTHGALRDASHEQIAGAAKQESHFLETLRGVKAVKLFRRQRERRAAWLDLMVAQTNSGLRAQHLSVGLRAAHGVLFGIEGVVVVYLGASYVLDGELSAGMLLAFVAYRRQFAARVSALIDKTAELRLLRLHAERLADVVHTEPERDTDTVTHTAVARDEGIPTLELRGVRFRYGEEEPYVLDGVDLSISPGECVAIVGTSGCGKSTLVNLLLGIAAPASGEVLIGGVSLASTASGALRRRVAAVTQGDCLFAGSIAENIAFFAADADVGRIAECARLAAIHSEIVSLPMGYDTLVGFLGTALSAGQQQRILVARALYSEPAILVLDEATSHLDVGREREVSAALRELRMTRVVVAHRPETFNAADRVFVLERGRLRVVRERSPLAHDPLPPGSLGEPSLGDRELLGSLGC
jgi:ATP-binding cassette subfamily B protein RaxB